MSSPMVAVGGTQVLSGVVILLLDIIYMILSGGVSGTLWMGLTFGIFYIITGVLGVCGGKAAVSGGGRGLAIAALVMSILSILNSFALIIAVGLWVAALAIGGAVASAAIVGIQLAFFIVMFISCIVMCVFAVRAMSASSSRTTHVTQVTHVVGQPGMVYATGPQGYPAGQPGQYAAPYPQKV